MTTYEAHDAGPWAELRFGCRSKQICPQTPWHCAQCSIRAERILSTSGIADQLKQAVHTLLSVTVAGESANDALLRLRKIGIAHISGTVSNWREALKTPETIILARCKAIGFRSAAPRKQEQRSFRIRWHE